MRTSECHRCILPDVLQPPLRALVKLDNKTRFHGLCPASARPLHGFRMSTEAWILILKNESKFLFACNLRNLREHFLQ